MCTTHSKFIDRITNISVRIHVDLNHQSYIHVKPASLEIKGVTYAQYTYLL